MDTENDHEFLTFTPKDEKKQMATHDEFHADE